MKKIIFVIGFCLISSITWAEIIFFVDGTMINGNIISRSDDEIEVDEGVGVIMTYYMENINTIDGESVRVPIDETLNTMEEAVVVSVLQDINQETQEQVSVLSEEVRRHMKKKEYKEAEDKLKEIIILSPNDWLKYNLLGILQFEEGNSEAAIVNFNKALMLEKDHEVKNDVMVQETCMRLIPAYLYFKKFEKAEEAAIQCVKRYDDFSDPLGFVATFYQSSLKYKQAITFLEKILPDYPDFIYVRLVLGQSYIGQASLDQDFEEMIQAKKYLLEVKEHADTLGGFKTEEPFNELGMYQTAMEQIQKGEGALK